MRRKAICSNTGKGLKRLERNNDMIDQNTFLETLREAAEIARTSSEPLSSEEIHQFFAGMDLTAEQEKLVSQYLKKPLETAETEADGSDAEADDEEPDGKFAGAGIGGREISINEDHLPNAGNKELLMESGDRGDLSDYEKENSATEGKLPGQDELFSEDVEKDSNGNDSSLDQLSDSAYYRMYLSEVREKGSCSGEQLRELYQKLIAGEDAAGQIADGWLLRIIRMAELYKENPVNMQDLIQEGNIALWMALSEIPETMAVSAVDSFLEGRVRNAFEEHIREETGDVDRTQAVLAKAGLLHEAQEVLAKENGQVPSLRELSEYTHISVEEIQSILALYEQKEN